MSSLSGISLKSNELAQAYLDSQSHPQSGTPSRQAHQSLVQLARSHYWPRAAGGAKYNYKSYQYPEPTGSTNEGSKWTILSAERRPENRRRDRIRVIISPLSDSSPNELSDEAHFSDLVETDAKPVVFVDKGDLESRRALCLPQSSHRALLDSVSKLKLSDGLPPSLKSDADTQLFNLITKGFQSSQAALTPSETGIRCHVGHTMCGDSAARLIVVESPTERKIVPTILRPSCWPGRHGQRIDEWHGLVITEILDSDGVPTGKPTYRHLSEGEWVNTEAELLKPNSVVYECPQSFDSAIKALRAAPQKFSSEHDGGWDTDNVVWGGE